MNRPSSSCAATAAGITGLGKLAHGANRLDAARLFRGPLLLAKAKSVGDDEADILRADLNKGGWKVKLRPFLDDRVMGAWEATFTRGKEVYKTNVCDFPSAGDSLLPIDANAFSIFF